MKYRYFVITSFIFLFYSTNIKASDELKMWSINECLNSKFIVDLSTKESFLGLVKHRLTIKKSNCLIKVSIKSIFKNSFDVDVCRKPIHIKQRSRNVVVLKKKNKCSEEIKKTSMKQRIINYMSGADKSFCESNIKIKNVIQDEGLIFARGEKENIQTDHGKINCVYTLLKGYLDKEKIYTRYKKEDKNI